MQLSLAGKPQTRTGIKPINWSAGNSLDIFQPGAMSRSQFLFKGVCGFTRRYKQITIQALKVTLDFFPRDNRFDAIDRRRVTLGRKPGALFSVQAFEFVIPIIQCVDEMGRGARGLPTRNSAVI